MSTEQVVERVLETLAGDAEVTNMTRIPVRGPEGSYHICIGEGLLHEAGKLLANRGLRKGTAAIVTNPMIAPDHVETLADSLRAAGFTPTVCTVPEGEQHKTLASIASLYDQFLAAGLDRKSPVISLGGGVIGDMAGFAAASYLRGVPFVQIPTSLLAMVDASVGGKTGVDLPQGKNLVGAFKQPSLVIIDTAVMRTLPAAEFRSGLAEVIKHGIIGAPELFRQFEEEGPTNLVHLVSDAVRVKVEVVEEDPFEEGRRATLNLGHTFGHAIELVSNFTVRHGEGVALGLVAATEMAAALEYCDPSLVGRVRNVLDRVELPTQLNGYDVQAVIAAMGHDKKRVGKNIRFIIPQAIGDVVMIDNPGWEYVEAALGKILVT
ncbi:MAG: 3-dehydroquinate synthase [Caldilineaceae bacterium]